MFEQFEPVPTSWASFGLPHGDGGRGPLPARRHDLDDSRRLGTPIGPPRLKRLGLSLLVWSIFLLPWAVPGRGQTQPVGGERAPAVLTGRASEAKMQDGDRDPADDSGQLRMNWNKRVRKRRARLEDEDTTTPGGRFVAGLRAPVASSPWAIGPPDARLGSNDPIGSARSPILRC